MESAVLSPPSPTCVDFAVDRLEDAFVGVSIEILGVLELLAPLAPLDSVEPVEPLEPLELLELLDFVWLMELLDFLDFLGLLELLDSASPGGSMVDPRDFSTLATVLDFAIVFSCVSVSKIKRGCLDVTN
jgi:hypothetical protein